MKELQLFSEAQIQEWIEGFKKMIDELINSGIAIDRKMLLSEAQVSEILGVSERTMRTYRSKNKFHHIKLEGSIYYLRLILFYDLIMLSFKSIR